MNVLLDTCSFIWILGKKEKLSKKAQKIFADEKNTLYVSMLSIWEIMILVQIGKLQFHGEASDLIEAARIDHDIELLLLDSKEIYLLNTLPLHHKDPFDRMLICQALKHNLSILTPDVWIKKYNVKTIW